MLTEACSHAATLTYESNYQHNMQISTTISTSFGSLDEHTYLLYHKNARQSFFDYAYNNQDKKLDNFMHVIVDCQR